MDAEAIALRLKALEQERAKKLIALGASEVALREAQGNVRACEGAIEDCRYWLGKLKAAPAPSEKENT